MTAYVILDNASNRLVRTPDYKYIAYRDDPTDQLFDMKHDPWETKNLAAEPEHASVVADHRKLLADREAPFDVAPIRQPKRPGIRPARSPS
ncbi:MAG: hypothetical protein ABIP48_02430 [Planctomycetota bacterium]